MAISFEFPALLYALLLLPLLALLQLILPRARRVKVPSLAFWHDVVAESAASTARRFRRLDLAAWLLLAMMAALILALAGPSLTQQKEAGVACTLVVDVSPSLLMTDGSSQTRLVRLRQLADQFLSHLPPDTPTAVVTVPAQSNVPPLEGPAAEVRRQVLDRIDIAQSPLTPRELRNRVLLLHSRTQAPVVLLTDVSPYDTESPQPPQVSLLATGAAAKNLALTMASVAYRGNEAFAMLSATVPEGTDAAAAATLGGRDMPAIGVTLPLSAGRHTWSFPVPRALPDRVTLAIDVVDDFAADNRLDLVRVEGRHWRVAYVGRPDTALLSLLQAAGAEVFEADQPPDTWPENLDVGIFVDRLPPASFVHPAVIANPPSSFGPLTRTEDVRRQVRTWRLATPSDPIAAHLPDTGPPVAEAPVFKLGPNATPVITTEQGDPLVARFGQGAAARVAVLFDIDGRNTAWSREISFVIFWDNCLNDLASRPVSAVRYVLLASGEASLGEIEGAQTDGPAIDESAQALAAVKTHVRRRNGRPLRLWPALVIGALMLLVLRTKVMRS